MRCRFCILAVVGDLLDDGELRFVEAVQSAEDALVRIEALAESQPGQYIIYDEYTGERTCISAGVSGSSVAGSLSSLS